MKNVRRILLISLSCIGDVLLTTPVLTTLRERFPDARITVVTGKGGEPIMRAHEAADECMVFDNRGAHKGLRGQRAFLKLLRRERYDIVVDLRNTAFPWLVRARRRISGLKANRANRDNLAKHDTERHLDVLRSGGVEPASSAMSATIPSEAREAAAKRLAEFDPAGERRLFAAAPGAGGDYKRYPPELFAGAVRHIHKAHGLYPVFVGGPADREAGETIESLCDFPVCNAIGSAGLLEAGALMQKCEFMISNDSGPMHLASALGLPVLAIFGPTNANRYGPASNPLHRIVWVKKECNPCKTPHCGLRSCVDEIQAVQINAAADEILAALKSRGPESPAKTGSNG